MEIKVKRNQWPIGQGGFASATIGTEDSVFEYIYDCGSFNLDALTQCINDYAPSASVIDVLFVSHVDSDHINGLDILCANHDVNTVVLPYISEIDVVLIAAKATNDGTYTSALKEFLYDPVTWFVQKGISNVVLVKRKDSSNTDTPTNQDNLPVSLKNNNDKSQSERLNVALHDSGKTTQDSTGNLIFEVNNSSFSVSHGDQPMWILVPFVPPLNKPSLDTFWQFLKKNGVTIECDSDSREKVHDILKLISKKEMRQVLKSAYNLIGKNLNNLSLCLYSGPVPSIDCHKTWHATSLKVSPYTFTSTNRCGWLATGDYNFQLNNYFDAFIEHYEDFTDSVCTMMLPHHGSKHNFSDLVVKKFSPLIVYACAGTRRKHPHSEVQEKLKNMDIPMIRVSEIENSRLIEDIVIFRKSPQARI